MFHIPEMPKSTSNFILHLSSGEVRLRLGDSGKRESLLPQFGRLMLKLPWVAKRVVGSEPGAQCFRRR